MLIAVLKKHDENHEEHDQTRKMFLSAWTIIDFWQEHWVTSALGWLESEPDLMRL